MSNIKAWLNKDLPRRRWHVLLNGVLDGAANQLRNKRIRELEKRIEALEGKRKVRVDL